MYAPVFDLVCPLVVILYDFTHSALRELANASK